MKEQDKLQLMRLLFGELEAEDARRLERRLESDEALRRELEAMRGVYEAATPLAEIGVPSSFSRELLARVRGSDAPGARPFAWVGAAMMLVGIGFGVLAGAFAPEEASLPIRSGSSLAEDYLEVLEDEAALDEASGSLFEALP